MALNIPLTNNIQADNPQHRPLIVIAYCYSTSVPRDVEAWVGQNNIPTVQDIVTTFSGTGRESLTFVVPWKWYYKIYAANQPSGNGGRRSTLAMPLRGI